MKMKRPWSRAPCLSNARTKCRHAEQGLTFLERTIQEFLRGGKLLMRSPVMWATIKRVGMVGMHTRVALASVRSKQRYKDQGKPPLTMVIVGNTAKVYFTKMVLRLMRQ